MNINGIDTERVLDLNSPIFAFYINVSNCSRQRADEVLAKYINFFNLYKNITVFVIPHDSITKMECIYDPTGINGKLNILHDQLTRLTQVNTSQELTMELRDILI
jgi:hypothetical protein